MERHDRVRAAVTPAALGLDLAADGEPHVGHWRIAIDARWSPQSR